MENLSNISTANSKAHVTKLNNTVKSFDLIDHFDGHSSTANNLINLKKNCKLEDYFKNFIPFNEKSILNNTKGLYELLALGLIEEDLVVVLLGIIAKRRTDIAASRSRKRNKQSKFVDPAIARFRKFEIRCQRQADSFLNRAILVLFPTVCQRAVLNTLSRVFMENNGICDKTNSEIACMAGVSISTVKTVKRLCCEHDIFQIVVRKVERNRNAPSLIYLIDPDWIMYLQSIKVKFVKNIKGMTDNLKKKILSGGGVKKLTSLNDYKIKIGKNLYQTIVKSDKLSIMRLIV